MAGGREVDAGEPGRRVIVREIMWGLLILRRGDRARGHEGIVMSSSSVSWARSPAHWRLSGAAEEGRCEGLGPSASMPEVAGLVPATRGLIAAPWTLASLSLWPAEKRVKTEHRTS